MAEKTKYPVAIFELIGYQGSGFFLQDVQGMPTRNGEIRFPKNRCIVNRSYVRTATSEEGVFENTPIRYIYGEKEILVAKQDERKVLPNPKMDQINFEKGFITVVKNGSTIGLYNFMQSHARNESNENRFEHLDPIFREIKPAENAQERSYNEFEQSDAINYIRQYVSEKGGGYVYNEERINALSLQFNIAASSTEEKVEGLIYFAKANPKHFLNEAKKSEQIVLIEVKHGLHLKVIEFAGNTLMYVKKNQKIKTFTGNLSKDENKMLAVANYFQTVDGTDAYELYKAELSAAKEAELNK